MFWTSTRLLPITAAAVTEITYGQDVHLRVGTAIAVAVVRFGLERIGCAEQSTKHFIGVTWFAENCERRRQNGRTSGASGTRPHRD
jgi:hypothetical protein